MSFEKYSTRKIEQNTFDIVENAIALRHISKEMVDSDSSKQLALSVDAASLALTEISNKIELLKVSFANLTHALVGDQDEEHDGVIAVEQSDDGSVKF